MKLTKTFTIDEEIWNKFDKIAKENGLNKSLCVENYMLDVIKKTENLNYFDFKNTKSPGGFDVDLPNKFKKVWFLKEDDVIEQHSYKKGDIIAAINIDNEFIVQDEFKNIFIKK